MVGMNLAGLRSPFVYALFTTGLWLAMLQSGVHATIAGVLAATAIPSRSLIPPETFSEIGISLLKKFQKISETMSAPERRILGRKVGSGIFQNPEQVAIVEAIERSCEKVQSPLQQLERALHPIVVFFIMPVFALANAGVVLSGDVQERYLHPVTLGVMAGLFLGKPVGIFLFSWVSVKLGMCELPDGANWMHVLAVGFLGGIGFTMSLFVTNLAFTSQEFINESKQAVLTASALAAVAGAIFLQIARRPRTA
jgi:Na+/H+ antiporter